MVESYVIGNTKTRCVTLDEDGMYILVDNRTNSLAITDVLISIEAKNNKTKGKLVLQIGDNERSKILLNIDINKTKNFSHSFAGLPKFWKGARIEAFKNFKGIAYITVCYLKLNGEDYSIWNRN